MVTARVMLALGLLVAAGAGAQAPDQRQNDGPYYVCVRDYALKFTSTNVPASDIAEAALSACQDHAHKLYLEVANALRSTEKADVTMERVRASARGLAIRNVLEARHPIK